jgi:hypothetical protein
MVATQLPLTSPDLVCRTDLDPYGSETQSDLETLTQDVLHLLLERPGTNPDDVDRGVGIETYLSGAESSLPALVAVIEAQVRRDDRVTSCTATVQATPGGAPGSYLVSVTVGVIEGVFPLLYSWQNGQLTALSGP